MGAFFLQKRVRMKKEDEWRREIGVIRFKTPRKTYCKMFRVIRLSLVWRKYPNFSILWMWAPSDNVKAGEIFSMLFFCNHLCFYHRKRWECNDPGAYISLLKLSYLYLLNLFFFFFHLIASTSSCLSLSKCSWSHFENFIDNVCVDYLLDILASN